MTYHRYRVEAATVREYHADGIRPKVFDVPRILEEFQAPSNAIARATAHRHMAERPDVTGIKVVSKRHRQHRMTFSFWYMEAELDGEFVRINIHALR